MLLPSLNGQHCLHTNLRLELIDKKAHFVIYRLGSKIGKRRLLAIKAGDDVSLSNASYFIIYRVLLLLTYAGNRWLLDFVAEEMKMLSFSTVIVFSY